MRKRLISFCIAAALLLSAMPVAAMAAEEAEGNDHLFHTPQLTNVKAATETESGYTGDLICSGCGEVLLAGREIPATGDTGEGSESETIHIHSPELVNAKEATETETGYTGDLVCSGCGEVLISGVEIPATEDSDESQQPEHTVHTPELINTKEPTKTEAGYTGDIVCRECGELLLAGQSVDPTDGTQEDPHSHTPELVNAKEATYLEAGYTGDVKCAGCGEILLEGAATQPAGMSSYLKTNPFTDVKPLDYFYGPVLWAYYGGITTGTSEDTFSPQVDCTRAQVVTFLWRANGSPEPRVAENPFADVRAEDYFYKAVLWAVENGVTVGTGETTFTPDKTCTRGEIVTFLWREQGKSGATAESDTFPDVQKGQFYSDAVAWAVEEAITEGYTDGTFRPERTCSRAEVVTFLYRCYTE